MNRFCKECGEGLKEDARFCPACGTTVTDTTTPPPVEPKVSIFTRIKQASKKQKIIGSSIIAVVILLIAGYQVGAVVTDKDNLIDQFQEALSNHDAKAMANVLDAGDADMEITEESLTGLMEIIKEIPSAQQYYIDEIKAQSVAYDAGSDATSDTIFSLEKDGKTALIYDNYTIEVMPFYFQVGTNMSDVQILIDNEEVAVSDSDDYSKEFGPVLPGAYQIATNYQNEYAVLENQVAVQLLEPHDQDQYLDLSLYGEYVTLASEYEDIAESTAFYVNEKEVTDAADEGFGPVSVDGSVEAYSLLSFPWGEAKSEVTPIDYAYVDLYVPSPFSKDVRTEIINTVHTFGEEYAAAQKERDASLLTTATSDLREEEVGEFDYMNDWDQRWTGSYQQVIVDLDSFDVDKDDDVYSVALDAQLHYADAADYNKGDEDIETDDLESAIGLKLSYNAKEEGWSVADYYSLWDFDATNTEERTVETQ